MGIFNRAIPNIQTNNLNQVRVTPSEEYYVDDIFDPLFNAKVKEQLRAKYGNPFLGTIGGYLEGIDNALIGQDDKWGILGSGMGILSGFGRSMDKAGDFIIGGLTEGVKGLTGQGFENPIRNIFVEDEDYTGTRLLAAMGNSMAGIAKAPMLDESDFKGLWNIPATGLELMTDPGILGSGLKKAGTAINLGKQVAEQPVNSKLANVGQLLMDYDDFMAKVSMDITAPGLRLGAKALKDKIWQKLGVSDYRHWANIKFNSKETPEARAQADDFMRNDSDLRTLMEMDAEIDNVVANMPPEDLTENVNNIDANTVQIATGALTTVPTAVQEEISPPLKKRRRRKSKQFKALVADARERERELIRKAYTDLLSDYSKKDANRIAYNRSLLQNFNEAIDSDLRRTSRNVNTALAYGTESGLIKNLDTFARANDIPEEISRTNFTNYEALQKAIPEIQRMDKAELEANGINPEYASQINFGNEDEDTIASGLFYEIVPNASANKAILAYAGIRPDTVKGLSLPTPVTFSPSDYAGRTDRTVVRGLKATESLLYEAFGAAGVPLKDVRSPDELDTLLLEDTPQGSLFKTAFPDGDFREHLVSELKDILFPNRKKDLFKHGAVEYLNKVNTFANEIISYNKLKTSKYTPKYLELTKYAKANNMEFLDVLDALHENMDFVKWTSMNHRDDYDYIQDVIVLENKYNFASDPETALTLNRGAELYKIRQYYRDSLSTSLQADISKAHSDYLKYDKASHDLENKSKETSTALLDPLRVKYGFMSRHDTAKSRAALGKLYADDTYSLFEDLKLSLDLNLETLDNTFREMLSPDDAIALDAIDSLPLSNPNNVSKALQDLTAYNTEWESLVAEYELANNSMQGSLWHKLLDFVDVFQSKIYRPLRNGAPIGYRPSSLEFSDTHANAVDMYGKKVDGGAVKSKHSAVSASDSSAERSDVYTKFKKDESSTKQDTTVPVTYEYGDPYAKSKKDKYSTEYYLQNIKTDFGTRDIGYSGDADSYNFNRTINMLFRKNPQIFENLDDFKHVHDTVLKRLSNSYQIKYRPEFFFKNVPTSTPVTLYKNISKHTPDNAVAQYIISEGDTVVKQFDKEVLPVVDQLLKDGVHPWSTKYKPRKPKDGAPKEAFDRYERVLSNQAKIQDLLGYSDNPHPLASKFRVIQRRLPIELYNGTYQFKLTHSDIVPSYMSPNSKLAKFNAEQAKLVSKLKYNRKVTPISKKFPKLKPYLTQAPGLTLRISENPAFLDWSFDRLKSLYEDEIRRLKGIERNLQFIQQDTVDTALNSYTYHSARATLDHLTLSDYVELKNAEIRNPWKEPIKIPTVREGVERVMGKYITENYRPFKNTVSKTRNASLKATEGLQQQVVEKIIEAPAEEAADLIDNMPTVQDIAKAELLKAAGIPEDYTKMADEPNAPSPPPDPPKTPPKRTKRSGDIIYPPKFNDLMELINWAVVSTSRAGTGDRATLRTPYVQQLINDADLLMTKHHFTSDEIAKYKRAQIYLSGAAIRKEEFMRTLASSGMFEMAYKSGEDYTKAFDAIRKNVAEVNVALGSNVLKPIQFKLSNGTTIIGAMWDTSNDDILNVLKNNYKKLDSTKLLDVVRLPKGEITQSVADYIGSERYRILDEFFDKVRQKESEYAKVLGFKYDDTRHVKNIQDKNPEVANYFDKVLYKDLPMSDIDEISDRIVSELDIFKDLRGSWGSRRYDKRLIGYIEDFEMDGIRLFNDNASAIVKGSLAEGSFNNSKFQLYIDLFDNDNFRINTYFKTPEDLERVLYAKLEDGSSSGNLTNLVLAAPRKDATGRVIGFTQFDKTTRIGLQNALNNPNTVLLPAHVFSPLDKILRKDAKMSNKIYAFIQKHLTLPFKLGVLMNPGFLIGNANDAYLKQATTMAQKYGTSVSEELANVIVSVRDVYVLNNKFDDAYRRFLTHIQAEGFPIAPSNQISSLAATDPRIRKMLKNYVDGKLQKGTGKPIIKCELSTDERNTVKLWLLLNSVHTSSTFDKGFQDMDILAKVKNSSKYQVNTDPLTRFTMGKGEYVSDDFRTWGAFSNPLTHKTMEMSEAIENTARAATILNDLRHRGMDAEWFKEYFATLEDLKTAAKTDAGSAAMRAELKKKFNFDMSEAINAMHNANFDYERMTDFTDAVGTFVPFPTFFLKNLGYWLEILVNYPQYIDRAITVQEGLWGSRDTSKDKFAAEAKGRGAVPVSLGGQNLSSFFKGIFKPTPLQSMFGAFSLINSPVEDLYFRLHPAIAGGISAASQIEPIKSITADVIPSEAVKYRPYSTDMYERNITRDDPNFNPVSYAIHRANPLERTVQTALRLPDKLKNNQAQLSDFSPSLFQPDFGEKYSK